MPVKTRGREAGGGGQSERFLVLYQCVTWHFAIELVLDGNTNDFLFPLQLFQTRILFDIRRPDSHRSPTHPHSSLDPEFYLTQPLPGYHLLSSRRSLRIKEATKVQKTANSGRVEYSNIKRSV
jgi:hypothetical protein